MQSETVTCVRCRTTIPANQADFSADGMLCRNCAVSVDVAGRLGVSSVGDQDLSALERSLARSTYTKHTLLGIAGLVGGIAVLSFTGSSGDILVVPLGAIIGGMVELARGLNGLAANPRDPKR